MKENSAQDTAWLSKETDEFLATAIIWPLAFSKVFHVWGMILVTSFFASVVHDYWVLLGFASTGILHALHKLRLYKEDIVLIRNEQARRNPELLS